eukprot:tig00020510_g9923.t1
MSSASHWRSEDGAPPWRRELAGPRSSILCVAISRDGRRVAAGMRGTYEDSDAEGSADSDGSLWLWELPADLEALSWSAAAPPPAPLQVEKAHYGEDVRSLCFAPDGERLASGGADCLVRLRCARSGREASAVAGHSDPVLCLAFSLDGLRLASGGNGVRLWDLSSGTPSCLAVYPSDDPVHALALRPSPAASGEGYRLLAGDAGGRLRLQLWLAAEGKGGTKLLDVAAHSDIVSGAAFSAGGDRVMSSGYDESVRVWDASTGAEAARVQGTPGGVWSLALSEERDGRLALCGGDAAALALPLDLEGDPGRAFLGEAVRLPGPARCVALSADGRLAATAGPAGPVALHGPGRPAADRATREERVRAALAEAAGGPPGLELEAALATLPRAELEALAAAVARELARR